MPPLFCVPHTRPRGLALPPLPQTPVPLYSCRAWGSNHLMLPWRPPASRKRTWLVDLTLSQLLVLSVSHGRSRTPVLATPPVLPRCPCSCFSWRARHPSLAAWCPHPDSREPARAPQRPCGCGPGSPPRGASRRGSLRAWTDKGALRAAPRSLPPSLPHNAGFVRPGRAELSGNFPFFPQERLFNLKIIECGKCWIWKLFTRVPFLFLPLAVPTAVGGGAVPPRPCSARGGWGLGVLADEPRAADAAAVAERPHRESPGSWVGGRAS